MVRTTQLHDVVAQRNAANKTTRSTPSTARLSGREAGTARMRKLATFGWFGYLVEHSSPSSYEPKAQLEDLNSSHVSSVRVTRKRPLLKHYLRLRALRQIVSHPQFRSVTHLFTH